MGGSPQRRVSRQREFVDFAQPKGAVRAPNLNQLNKSSTELNKMESLLSLSFDYLSSYDGVKVRKGLRQLEGLLAQICLSRTNTPAADRRSSVIPPNTTKQATKELSSLKDDPAFREFFKLQEGFEWNGMSPHPTFTDTTNPQSQSLSA